jgi:hypothetical protein
MKIHDSTFSLIIVTTNETNAPFFPFNDAKKNPLFA